ncbi:hypothetical protein PIROE2DRAFT_18437 [Piromyces sp. E2]|nr:hypothetical protein PIROE2DRAFT_18437 [Piromyces sp. E2]|eukprot:OUM56804.1 hypothetical protein PIROE2DRAFT_18437 [Piromyces sp. E2]
MSNSNILDSNIHRNNANNSENNDFSINNITKYYFITNSINDLQEYSNKY